MKKVFIKIALVILRILTFRVTWIYQSSAGYRITVYEVTREDLRIAYINEVMNTLSNEIPETLVNKISVIPVEN
jgi:hypothetical protein